GSKKLIAIFDKQEAIADMCNTTHDLLKINDEAMAPIFHPYDTAKIRAARKLRSIIVTDIPLFCTEQDVLSSFKRFGTIDSHYFRTPSGANFQKVEITFTDSSVHDNFIDKWCIYSRSHCLRVYPATFNKQDQDARMEFTAVLKNLPPNITAVDLSQIISEVSASSIGLPKYVGSYKSNPWAYFQFRTQQLKDAAM